MQCCLVAPSSLMASSLFHVERAHQRKVDWGLLHRIMRPSLFHVERGGAVFSRVSLREPDMDLSLFHVERARPHIAGEHRPSPTNRTWGGRVQTHVRRLTARPPAPPRSTWNARLTQTPAHVGPPCRGSSTRRLHHEPCVPEARSRGGSDPVPFHVEHPPDTGPGRVPESPLGPLQSPSPHAPEGEGAGEKGHWIWMPVWWLNAPALSCSRRHSPAAARSPESASEGNAEPRTPGTE